jgi:putative DNA primase/helicase
MQNTVYRRARQLRRLGFAVVPVERNGSKRIALQSWKKYQEQLCDQNDLKTWFAGGDPCAVGIIGGEISGNLEILDFDDESVIAPFEEMMRFEHAELLVKLIVVETGSGKRHYLYRCESPPGGRRILARNPPPPGKKKGKVAIEARADGCMTIAAGSPADTHSSGRPYRRIGGPTFSNIQVLTDRERKQLHRICRSLTRWVDDTKTTSGTFLKTDSPVNIARPGDHFNEVADWGEDVLEPIGFELVREDADGSRYWLRPGGSHAWSVRTGLQSQNGRDLMRVFSTDTEYFEADRSYDKFAAHAAIHHDDDLSVAAADLSRQGYGVDDEDERDDGDADRIIIRPFSKIRTRRVRWLWPDRIPTGKLTVLSGDPSVGKSFTFCSVSAHVSLGLPFPDDAPCRRGDVLIVSCEDDAGDTLKPRLRAHGADLERVHCLTVETAEGEYQQLDIGQHIEQLADTLDTYPETRLLVFDPLTAYLGNVDANSNADVRRVLGPLCELGRQHRVAIVGVSHLRKKETRAVARTLGSVAFVAAARANWIIVRDPKDRDRRLFLQAKNNLADAPGMAFRIVDGRIEWEPDPVYDNVDIAGQQSKVTPREIAEAFLERALQDGPVPADQILEEAMKKGISKTTLYRVKRDLKVDSQRSGNAWLWALIEQDETGDQDGQ